MDLKGVLSAIISLSEFSPHIGENSFCASSIRKLLSGNPGLDPIWLRGGTVRKHIEEAGAL